MFCLLFFPLICTLQIWYNKRNTFLVIRYYPYRYLHLYNQMFFSLIHPYIQLFMNFHYLLLAPSNTTSRTSPHHHLHDGVYLALYPTVHKDNPVNYIQRSKSSVPSAKNISISAQVDECGRVQQNAASNFCQKIRYELQKYRTHPDKSALSLPIPDGNQEYLLYHAVGYHALLYSNTDNGCLPDVPAMNGSLLFLRFVPHRYPPHILKHVWRWRSFKIYCYEINI